MAKKVVKTKEQYRAAVHEMQKAIDEKIKALEFEVKQEIYDLCLEALGNSVSKAPVEIGTLRGTACLEINGIVTARGNKDGSITVLAPMPDGPIGDIHARIAFPEQYALIQHEHPEFDHPLGGQAFYLEIGVAEAIRGFRQSKASIALG